MKHLADKFVFKMISAFRELHPNCLCVFTFDQRTNHAAFSKGALLAKRMNMNSGEAQSFLRDGWYINVIGNKVFRR